MNKANLSKKIKMLGHLSRMEKMRMNEWMVKKSEITQKILQIEASLEELQIKIVEESQIVGDAITYMDSYSSYIAQKRERLFQENDKLNSELDRAQDNLSIYFTQHKTYENLQNRSSVFLQRAEEKEQRDTLDEIATLRFVRQK